MPWRKPSMSVFPQLKQTYFRQKGKINHPAKGNCNSAVEVKGTCRDECNSITISHGLSAVHLFLPASVCPAKVDQVFMLVYTITRKELKSILLRHTIDKPYQISTQLSRLSHKSGAVKEGIPSPNGVQLHQLNP